MTHNIECPYCGKDNSTDDYYETAEDDRIEVECLRCGKKFQYSWSSTVVFSVHQADCLNDGNHKWERQNGAPKEYFINKVRCGLCGEEKEDAAVWGSLQ